MTPEERLQHRKGPITLRGHLRPDRTTDQRLLEEDGSGQWVHSDPWRVLRIQSEFVEGFGALAELGPAISIFGSARLGQDDPYYRGTVELAKGIVELGYAVITGGGPGVMEAGNRGAHDAGGISIGLNIVLPHEQAPNAWVTPDLAFNFHYFAIRKMHFLMRAKAICIFPGGFGTLDEMFESLTLIQTGRMERIPFLLFGREFWERIINWPALADAGTIADEDLDLFRFVETAEEAVDWIDNWPYAGEKRSIIPDRPETTEP